MVLKFPILFILLQLTLSSKSSCEDDKSFFDSYGWSCKDYDRAPEECKVGEKYEKDGKTALKSCCICRNAFKKPDILDYSGLSFLHHFDSRRRQLQQCQQNCVTETEGCSNTCETVETKCQAGCSETQNSCFSLCATVEEPTEEEENAGVVEDETVASPSSTTLEWYYILIIALLIVGLCICCLALLWFMRNRVKTAVFEDPSKNFHVERAPMVRNGQYAQGVQEYHTPAARLQYDQQFAGGCTGGPVYS